MVETVSHTNYEVYDVTAFSGGTVTINIDSIVHLNRNGWDGTIGVYFLDISDNPVGQNFDAETTSWYPALAGVTDDQYNQVVLIPDLIRPDDGGTPYTNVSFNVPVPFGATKMFWFVWINAGPSNTANYNWDLVSGDKFFLTESYYQNDITNGNYAKRTYPRRSHFGPDGQTIVQSPLSEVRGQPVTQTVAANTGTHTSATSHNGSSKYYIKSDGVTANGKLSYYNSSNTELFYWEGIAVTGEAYVNQGPTVVVPADSTVLENTSVNLSAAGTFDPEGDTLTYSWTQMAGPAVTISNANTPLASFVTLPMHWSDTDVVYSFSLGVSDGINPTVYDTVNITAQAEPNAAPSVNSFYTKNVNGGVTFNYVNLSAIDADGDTLTYSWSQLSGPSVTIDDLTVKNPQITVPTLQFGSDNIAVLRCTVTDTGGLSAVHELRIVIATEPNQSPTAIATSDKDNINGVLVTLSGAASTDPEGYGLTYSWEGISSTNGVIPTLSDTSSVSPTFTAPTLVAGDSNVVITYRLTVTDSGGLTSTDDVVITVKAPIVPNTDFDCNTCGGGYCPTIATNIMDNAVTGVFDGDAKTYDPSNGAILNDGTSEMPTFTFDLNGVSYTGYIGLNNMLYVKRIKTPARDVYDNTYGYSYELASPVGRVGSDSVYYNYYVV